MPKCWDAAPLVFYSQRNLGHGVDLGHRHGNEYVSLVGQHLWQLQVNLPPTKAKREFAAGRLDQVDQISTTLITDLV